MRQPAIIAVVAACCGFLAGALWAGRDEASEATQPVTDRAPSAERVGSVPIRPVAHLLDPATPDVDAGPLPVAADCTRKLGCECPPPPPADLDPRYREAAISDWLETVDEDCPLLHEREQVLDCSTFPCLLGVATQGEREEVMTEDHAGFVTCGAAHDEDAPELVFLGNVGRPGDFFLTFAIRPKSLRDYTTSEMARAMTFTSE